MKYVGIADICKALGFHREAVTKFLTIAGNKPPRRATIQSAESQYPVGGMEIGEVCGYLRSRSAHFTAKVEQKLRNMARAPIPAMACNA